MNPPLEFKVSLGDKLIGYEQLLDQWYRSASERSVEWAFGNFIDDESVLSRWQYTGKKDCKGKKIYAGDIIDYFGIIKIVAWNDETAQWCLKRSLDTAAKFTEQLATSNLNKTTVVGAIFHNPELVPETK